VTVQAGRAGLTTSSIGVAGKDKELLAINVVHLRLGSNMALASRLNVRWKRHDVLSDELWCTDGDIVLQHAGVGFLGAAGAIVLYKCGLHECKEVLVVGRNGQTFKTVVVITTSVGVGWVDIVSL